MNRAQMLYALDDIVEMVKKTASDEEGKEPVCFIPKMSDLSDEEMMEKEFDHLGFFISKHPLDGFRIKLSELDAVADLAEKQDKSPVHMGGLMMNAKSKVTKKGSTMGFFTLEDNTGRCEVVVFPRTYNTYKYLFESKNLPVEVNGYLERQVREWDGNEVVTNKLIARTIKPLEHAEKIERLTMSLIDTRDLEPIKELLLANPGSIPVDIEYAHAKIKTPIKVDQTKNFLNELAAMCNIKKYYASS